MASPRTAQAVASQKVRWGPNDSFEAGIHVWSREDESDKQFLTWADLTEELDRKLLPQAFVRPERYSLKTFPHHNKKDWLVRICNDAGNPIFAVWFGGKPERNWVADGLIHVGEPPPSPHEKARIWQTWQRFSDGSYRLVFSKCANLDEPDRWPLP